MKEYELKLDKAKEVVESDPICNKLIDDPFYVDKQYRRDFLVHIYSEGYKIVKEDR